MAHLLFNSQPIRKRHTSPWLTLNPHWETTAWHSWHSWHSCHATIPQCGVKGEQTIEMIWITHQKYPTNTECMNEWMMKYNEVQMETQGAGQNIITYRQTRFHKIRSSSEYFHTLTLSPSKGEIVPQFRTTVCGTSCAYSIAACNNLAASHETLSFSLLLSYFLQDHSIHSCRKNKRNTLSIYTNTRRVQHCS